MSLINPDQDVTPDDVPVMQNAGPVGGPGMPTPGCRRGYGWLYLNHVLQVDEGCDFDFLTSNPRPPSGWPSGRG